MRADRPPNCITYVRIPHLGFGHVQNCVSILEHFPNDRLCPTLILPKAFRPVSKSVRVIEASPPGIPLRFTAHVMQPALTYRFKRALARSAPTNTIAYFWPQPPLSLVRFALDRGFVTVREMINTCIGSAKIILDDAYRRVDVSPGLEGRYDDNHSKLEREELRLYDYILSPSPRVEQSLIEAGIDPAKILRSSYGWLPSRFAQSVRDESKPSFRAIFIGTVCVRKGIPQLLEAWKKSGVNGELLLVGDVELSLRPMLSQHIGKYGIRHTGFDHDVGQLFKSADVFVFPTLEEGDPLVTYEAAGCGLPVITTPMGSANIIKDGVNGFVVDPYNIDALAEAIVRLATDDALRARFAAQCWNDAQGFTYEKVGMARAELLRSLLHSK